MVSDADADAVADYDTLSVLCAACFVEVVVPGQERQKDVRLQEGQSCSCHGLYHLLAHSQSRTVVETVVVADDKSGYVAVAAPPMTAVFGTVLEESVHVEGTVVVHGVLVVHLFVPEVILMLVYAVRSFQCRKG